MKCLLIGIAISACVSVWTGPSTSQPSALEREQQTSSVVWGGSTAIR